jgi:hypothetical protein
MFPTANTTTAEQTYVCDGCDDTVTCTGRELTVKWKWRRYAGERNEGHGLKMSWRLLLCPDCRSKRRSS